jgi:hypothetical protein
LVEDGEIDDNEDHWTEDTAEVNYYVQSEEDLDEEEDSE